MKFVTDLFRKMCTSPLLVNSGYGEWKHWQGENNDEAK